MNYQTEFEIQIALANYFNPTKVLIIPNLTTYCMGREIDLLVLTKSLYAYEIEIKVSKADLRRDEKKKHPYHKMPGDLTRKLWFAMPESMGDCIDLVPTFAGIFLVDKHGFVSNLREATVNKLAKKWSMENAYHLAELGTMRLWNEYRNTLTRIRAKEMETEAVKE
jgi:hypothetical protein